MNEIEATRGRRTVALVGLIFAVSMTTIDQTIVALSAPTIQQDLGLTRAGIQWAVNAYLLTAAALFVVGGRLSDIYTHRRLALLGTAAFAVTSFLCGVAPAGAAAQAWLVTARALQGASAALLVPAAVGIVVQTYDVARRGRAMAIFFAITGAMTAIGPIAGGILTEWTWRAVFWVNLPIAAIGFTLVAVATRPSARLSGRLDWPGALLVSAAMLLVVLGLEQAPEWGWNSPMVWLVVVGGICAFVGFVAVECRRADPLVRLAAFRTPQFSLAVTASLVASVAFIPTFFFLSVYAQVSLDLTPLSAGLLFLQFFIGFVLASRFGSVMFDRRGARRVLIIGGTLGAVGFGMLATLAPQLGFDHEAFFNSQTTAIALAGAGIGFMYSPASTDAVNRAVGSSYGEVTALTQSARSFGGALGLAITGTVVGQAFLDNLTDSFGGLGLPADAARQAVALTSGPAARSQLDQLPPALAEQVRASVAQGYADAAHWAFVGFMITMIVVGLLGLIYPRSTTRVRRAGAGAAVASTRPREATS